MSDPMDTKLRELAFRLVAMAPEAPPFPEEALAQLKPASAPAPPTQRRSPLAWVAAAAAVTLLVVGIPLLLGSIGDPDSPVPPAASTASTNVTRTSGPGQAATTAPESSSERPSAAALHDLGVGTVVVAAPGAPTSALDGVVVLDAEAAIGDGSGGLVVLRDNAILRVAADGTETLLLDAASLTTEFGSVTLRLEDVARTDGTAKAVVAGAYGQEYPNIFEEIWFLDIDTGNATSVYRSEAVESTIARVSVANGMMVLSWMFEGGTYFEYLDATGQPIDVFAPYDGGLPGGLPDSGIWIDQAIVSPDGTTLAYLEIDTTQPLDDVWMVDLVIWDLDRGREVQRLAIELQAGVRHGRMDFDGVGAVLGRLGNSGDPEVLLAPLRIASLETGVVTELDTPGTPSLIKR